MAEPGPASGGIFISYRRQETEWAAAWLDDQLVAKFGRQRVFKDVDSIGPGEKFEETIGLALSSCTVLLALIGEGWLTATAGSGRPRLLDPDDLVRREIETALERNILVIPVLVSGASLPTEEELPPTLVSLPARQAQELNSGSFAHGAGRLIDAVERALRATGAGTATTEAAPPRSMPSEFDIAQAIWRGMDGVSEAIRRTLGPRERSVVIPQADGKPLLTSDARTIAAGLRFDDPQEAVGADLVGTLVSRMEDLAGGGAGTAVVLAQAMATEVLRQRLSGSSPMAMQRGINRGVELAVQSIRDQARYFESRDQLAHAASVAARDPEVGELIAKAMDLVGKEGVVTVGRSNTPGMELVTVEGMRIDRGYLSHYFITDPLRDEAVLENPYLLIADLEISSIQQLLPMLERVVPTGRSLVVIAQDLGEDALASMVVNKIRGNLRSVAIKAPGSGGRRKAVLADLAILTGGQVIGEEVGLKLEHASLDLLGRARRVVVTKDETTIVEGLGDDEEIRSRMNQLRAELSNSASEWDRDKLRERLAMVGGGVATIKLGGTTDAEFEQRKRLIERAYAVVHSAIDEGIVVGGGTALLRAQAALATRSDEAETVIVQRALEEPLRQLAINVGQDATEVLRMVRELEPSTAGFDAVAGGYVDLFEAGVVDSAKVLRIAIESAGATVVKFLSVI